MRAQLFAIGLGIALLLPLAVHTGVNILKPPPDWQKFYNQAYDQRRSDAKSAAEKQRITLEQRKEKARLDMEDKQYQKLLFFVSFPVGMVAIVVGTALVARSVGAGLMFGGILLLADGCYTYWDAMTTILRFGSALVSLGVFIAVGYWLHQVSDGSRASHSLLVPAGGADLPNAD